jgi:predicted AAA+ superfamily ATPase
MDLRSYMLTRKEVLKGLDVKERLIEVRENRNFIVSVVGPRRAGKTYFLYHLIRKRGLKDEDFVLINFEEPVALKELDEALAVHQEIYGREPSYIFLDEVQAFKGWERHVYALFERKRYYIFVTGSSSKLLSREIATQLRGRAFPVYVYPFSFRETLRARGVAESEHYSVYGEAQVRHLLSLCLRNGFFPDIVLGNIEPHRFFREFIDLVVYRDIIERFGLRNWRALEMFLESCISSNAALFSVHKVYNSLRSQGLRVSKKTLYAFQKIVEDVNFGFFLRKLEPSRRKAAASIPKFYLVDNGIYTYFEGENLGRLTENVVFLELVKRGYTPNVDLFYWRSARGEEVDFVVREGGRVKLIQVTYASGSDEVDRRELEALAKASRSLGSPNLEVVTWSYEDTLEIEGRKIAFVPLWKWVLAGGAIGGYDR